MKKFCIILSIAVGLSAVACKKDFLEKVPFNSYSTENFFQDQNQIQQAVNALYPSIRGLQFGAVWQVGEFRTDNTTFQFNPSDRGATAFESIDYFLAESNAGLFSGLWNTCYTNISRCHFILESIDEASFTDESARTALRAETQFARAYYYHLLTKNFGGVPLIDRVILTEEESATIPRSPIEEIYNQLIVPDLTFAIANLPDEQRKSDAGRASADAARMLLADAYFVQKDYAAALPLLQVIIESDRYQLVPNYRDILDPSESYNEEIIFGIQNNADLGQGAGFFVNWLPQNSGEDLTEGIFVGSLTGKHIPTPDMIRAYESGDKRREASIGFYIKDNDTIPYIRKYLYPPVGSGGSNFTLPIYRYGDAMLMYAEALIEVEGGLPNTAFELINTLRSRAELPFYFPGNPVEDLNIDSEEKLRQAIRTERRVELAFEFKRYYDLVRWGELESTMLAHGEEMKKIQDFLLPLTTAYTKIPDLLPIPFNQVLLYGYEQNPGW